MSFRLDKLTIKAQEAIQRAQSLAQERGHPEIDSLHLLAAMLRESDGMVQPILKKIGINGDQLTSMIQSELDRHPKVSGDTEPRVGKELSDVLQSAQEAAETMKDEFVSTEHLLLALTTAKCRAQSLLQLNGVRRDDLLAALQTLRGSAR